MDDFLHRIFPFLSRQEPAPPEKTYPPVPKRPPEGSAECAALDEAQAWLDASILDHARAFNLGEERSYAVDQETGLLSLSYADGTSIDLPIQVIASFRPQDRSLRWSWANSNVEPRLTEAACAARDHASTQSFAAFKAATFDAKFEDCVRLVALAAKLGGCDGVYRAFAENSLTVFVGYTAPPVQVPPPSPLEVEAIALLEAYDREMLPIDQEYHRNSKKEYDSELSSRALKAKIDIYKRYWLRDDQYWEPCSFAWPSDHDPTKLVRRFAIPRRAGGLYVISQTGVISTAANVLKLINGELRITDQDIDWGRGLLLSRPKPGEA